MAERKPASKDTQKSAKSATANRKKSKGFTDEERAAMKERAQELKAEARRADGESALLAKIAEMQGPDRAMATRLHAIVKASAPALSPKTWYGMPAYTKDGKVVLLLPKRGEVQIEVRDLRLQRRGEPRRRRHVADRLRAEGVDCNRRGKDRRAREESGELSGRQAIPLVTLPASCEGLEAQDQRREELSQVVGHRNWCLSVTRSRFWSATATPSRRPQPEPPSSGRSVVADRLADGRARLRRPAEAGRRGARRQRAGRQAARRVVLVVSARRNVVGRVGVE